MKAPTMTAFLAALIFSGCVVSPYNGERMEPHRSPIDFDGYAGSASADIDILVEDHCTGTWVNVGSTTAASSGYAYGGYTLYPWAVTVDLTGHANLSCYGSSGISLGSQISFRVQADGADLANYPGGGVSCVIDAVEAGDDLVTAGIDCGASYSDLTHRWDN